MEDLPKCLGEGGGMVRMLAQLELLGLVYE
jgi:hypothetical protein